MVRNRSTSNGMALGAVPFALAAALAAASMTAALARDTAPVPREPLTVTTASGRHTVEVEVADTEERKQLGLMFRTSLAPGHGMLFPYGRPQEITMWMRNTYISLDMVFIRGDGTVHRIERATEPMSEEIIASRGPVTAVLELAAGEADRLGIAPGARVEHPSFSAKGN